MSLEQHMYGSSDWRLPSPSSTPKSDAFPDANAHLRSPKAEPLSQSHFLDAWSTPRVNGHVTPADTPSFTFSTPLDRPSSSYSQPLRTPEDPEFHVNHLAADNLPLPPVEPSRRLSSSPRPRSMRRTEATLRENPQLGPRPVGMDRSLVHTPPPTRGASTRRSSQQHAGAGFGTPVTVIARNPGQVHPSDALYNQTPFRIPSLQFSPDVAPFPDTGPLSAPPMPQSRLFWESNEGHNMDVDMSMAADPFGPNPLRMDANMYGQTFHTQPTQMNPQAFHHLNGMSSTGAGDPFGLSYAPTTAADTMYSRPTSFNPPSTGVDPSMLYSFSSPGPISSFNRPAQIPKQEARQPYETQTIQSQREREEREITKAAQSQRSRTNTPMSNASFDNPRPMLQRSNTDSGFRTSRPSTMESRSSNSAAPPSISRRSSPLKRQSGGSLTSIPETRRSRTRLLIDENGRARTETVHVEDESRSWKATRRESQKDIRRQYPGLWNEEDSESESDGEPPMTLSRNASFNTPARRPSKHARSDSGGLERSSSFKLPRSSSGIFDKASFETIRPVRKTADNSFRRFSMMDFPTFNDTKDGGDQQMPDSPGDALGALKKVMEGRQKRIERSTENTLKAHNQRWAQVSADLNSSASPHGHGQYDPFNNTFTASSPATNTDAGFTTPSTDRSSLSSDSTRCICNFSDEGQDLVQCESCNKWLHMACVGLNAQSLPPVFVCIFCTGNTPVARGGRVRGPMPAFESPLTHKSLFRR